MMEQDTRQHIAAQLAKIRKEKGYTVRRLAELADVSPQNITKIEHARYNVSIDILGKICHALEARVTIVPTDDIIAAVSSPPPCGH